MKGEIKFFMEDKGFGFIIGEDNIEYFLHISNVENKEILDKGDLVNFTPGVNERGNFARKVFKS